jgi:telomere length regulation protein
LDVLAAILHGDTALMTTWEASTSQLNNAALAKTQSHSLVTLVSGGRIPSLAAETFAIADLKNLPERARWVSDGAEFSRWVGRNIACWARSSPEEATLRVCSDFIQRGMSLGYFGEMGIRTLEVSCN